MGMPMRFAPNSIAHIVPIRFWEAPSEPLAVVVISHEPGGWPLVSHPVVGDVLVEPERIFATSVQAQDEIHRLLAARAKQDDVWADALLAHMDNEIDAYDDYVEACGKRSEAPLKFEAWLAYLRNAPPGAAPAEIDPNDDLPY
jgi:hypothetical protein